MSDQQMTVARVGKPSSAMSKASRQVVPAFLQKLYEMVNDPKNSDLIRWSDAGDSFFVLDHERFAHDVLGRWFKHRNFSSFVRQLNMYGFHKIPHLQQGVLKSENETEFWNFAHPNFHRGQPDLLCLIQRKKTTNQGNGDDVELQDSTATAPGNGQVLDVQSVLNGIAAIKKHQSTISSELNELKKSNELLWQETMIARQRHVKQQNTIDRIVKFLAGVFVSGGHNSSRSTPDAAGVVIPRRGTRLMIEDAQRTGKNIVELDDMLAEDHPTPVSITSVDEDPSVTSVPETVQQDTPQPPDSPKLQQQAPAQDKAVTPRLSPSFDFDPRLFEQLTQPQIQQLLNQFSSQPVPEINPPPSSNRSTSPSHLTPYQPPPFDFSMLGDSGLLPPSSSSADGLISFNPLEAQWQHVDDVQRDVNAVDSSIQNIIQSLGLDPSLLDNSSTNMPSMDFNLPSTSGSTSNLNLDLSNPNSSSLAPIAPSDFDFDSLFNSLPQPSAGNEMDMNDVHSFLADVPSPAGTDSPAHSLQQVSPEMSTTRLPDSSGVALSSTAGKKRKSDVTDLDSPALDPNMDFWREYMAAGAPTTNDTSGGPTAIASTSAPIPEGKSKRRKEK
ncbi:transcription factor Hsf1 [Coprinopsis sp. MPI-PUGE-AT-0042]|nr:transcription factor Hsf1 [Coprinopsis sp. MPI-PUGE-AT-0042]